MGPAFESLMHVNYLWPHLGTCTPRGGRTRSAWLQSVETWVEFEPLLAWAWTLLSGSTRMQGSGAEPWLERTCSPTPCCRCHAAVARLSGNLWNFHHWLEQPTIGPPWSHSGEPIPQASKAGAQQDISKRFVNTSCLEGLQMNDTKLRCLLSCAYI